MLHHDSDAVVQDRIEGVLIGQVVADEDRQQRFVSVDLAGDPLQRSPFVPVQVRPQFHDHPPGGHPQSAAAADLVDGGGDGRCGALGRVAVVHGHRIPLVFDGDAGDIREPLGQLGGGVLECRHGQRGGFVVVVRPVGVDHLEAVTSGVPQAGYTDPLPDVIEAAAGQHRDRVQRGQ